MAFNSPLFVFTFPILFVLYFLIPSRWRWGLLLAASCLYYCFWEREYVFLLGGYALAAYLAALAIFTAQSESRKRLLLITYVGANLGVFVYFKYSRSFVEGFQSIVPAISSVPVPIRIPAGFSFYSLQAMSYVIDVYRGDVSPERRLPVFALFTSFFPQLVAGPISRARQLLPQFGTVKDFDSSEAITGLRYMLWGFFKKMVIADQVGIYAHFVFDHFVPFQFSRLVMAVYFYSLQIYCDFSGYSDIAYGCAKTVGYTLTKNFERPYLATSIEEFWRRWHISLSTWIRDYIYVPMMLRGGYSLGRDVGWLIASLILCGLWHGATWPFVLWGAYHGLLLAGGRMVRSLYPGSRLSGQHPLSSLFSPAVRTWTARFFVFHAVAFGWLLFRSTSIPAMVHEVLHTPAWGSPFIEKFGPASFCFTALSVVVLILVEMLMERGSMKVLLERLPAPARFAGYSVILWWILFSISTHRYINSKFIYSSF